MLLSKSLCILVMILLQSYMVLSYNDDDNSSTPFDPTVVILFMFFGLSIGILTTQLLSRIGDTIPYTVIIFIFGIFFSLFSRRNDTGSFGQSIEEWVKIDAELLLFIFLPPLIFGEAMSLSWHHVHGAFIPSAVLAGPGVLIGAALMAVFTKLILPYKWSWNLSFVFGSILSATDPVAVVALLKTAGASPKLTMLIVGESLMNDGTAMVLFTLFFKLLQGQHFTTGSIISFFLAATLGSSLLGIALGFGVIRWLRSAHRPLKDIDKSIQISITLCSAYLIFFLAQYTLQISGVLACCGAGLMLAWLAPPIILSHESMHTVWSIVEWMGNTLIFLLAGLIIGHRTLGHVQGIDWAYLIILYLSLMSIRAVVIAICYPFISNKSHKVTVFESIFISYAGLRGALSLALALIIENSTEISISGEASRMLFFVGGIAALTLLINAITSKKLLSMLSLIDTNTVEKELIINQIKKKLKYKMINEIKEMSTELNESDLEEVRMSCSILRDVIPNNNTDTDVDSGRNSMTYKHNAKSKNNIFTNLKNYLFSNHNKNANNNNDDNNNRNRKESMSERLYSVNRQLSMSTNRKDDVYTFPDLLRYVRAVFLEIVRVKYWHLIETGRIPRLSHSAQYLLYTIEYALDDLDNRKGLQDWHCLENKLVSSPVHLKVLYFIDYYIPNLSFITELIGRLEAKEEKRIVYILTSFIEAHEHAQQKIHTFIDLTGNNDISPNNTTTDPAIILSTEVSNNISSNDIVEADSENKNENENETDRSTNAFYNKTNIYNSLHNLNSFYLPNGNRILSTTHEPSPEEIKVINESIDAVATARKCLSKIAVETVANIKRKQIARSILSKEVDIVMNLMSEGLLTSKQADQFLEDISIDVANIEKQRNQMYYEHAKLNIKKRKQGDKSKSFYMYSPIQNTTDDPLLDA